MRYTQKPAKNEGTVDKPSPPSEPVQTGLKDYSDGLIDIPSGIYDDEKYVGTDIDGAFYGCNYSFIEKMNCSPIGAKFFYFNSSGGIAKQDPKPSVDILVNRQEYMKIGDRELVVRCFRYGDVDSMYVFTEEAIEVIRLALMDQGTTEEYAKLNSYSAEWDTKNAHLSSAILKSRFIELLSEFNVNQSNITIVDDATYLLQYEKSFRKELFPVTVMNCDGTPVMSDVNAMFYIFQSIVCGRQWALYEKDRRVEKFKKTYFGVMNEYLELKEGYFVSLEKVERDISKLKKCIKANKLKQATFDYFLKKYAHSDDLPGELNVEFWKCFGIQEPQLSEINSTVPVHKTRMFGFEYLIECFCEPEMINLKLKLVDGISTKVPWGFIKEDDAGMREHMIKQAAKHESEIKANVVTGNSDTAAVHQEAGSSTDGIDAPSEMTVRDNGEEAPSAPPPNPVPTSTTSPAISTACDFSCQTNLLVSSCLNCSKNIKLRSDAQDKAKTAENSLKKVEYNAKQAVSRGKELKIKEKEVQDLKSTVEERDYEIKRLKEELQKKSWGMERLEDTIKKKDGIIEKEKQETIDAKGKNASLRRRVEDLQMKFVMEQSKVDQMIEKCKNIQPCPSLNRSRVIRSEEPSTSEPSTSQLPPRAILHQWQKLKDDLNRNKLLDEQKDMIENLIERTEDLHVQRFAQYELVRFEGTRNIYLQTIEMNIAKIKKTDDTSSLLPLPEYPKLSDTFLEHYQNELKNQPEPVEPGFDPNVECYICLEEFSEENDKFFGWKCTHPAHLKCAEKWKNTQLEFMNMKETACGYCRKMEEEEKLRKEKNQKKAKK
ncbi:hypothetical protein CAEBREN_03349 [Caenorhabditis brenneri]|uniref:RING-type domain-containing protein n=1 Tax=Caenorhabditis brenneri TaxID=135651 RepID=G0P7B8_CAEBE|nr:hypothetical protein CAEBREN_03349 [Caenorhabditis brenneri]